MSVILVISNPVSGGGNGDRFVRQHVLPLIEEHQHAYELRETTGPGAAGALAADFVHKQPANTTVTIVISGGDGTVHEVINDIGVSIRPLQLVICPQGTANALYSTLFPLAGDQLPTLEYSLQSLQAYFHGRARPLTLLQTRLLSRDSQVIKSMLGIVVASTSLHASILDSAERLRQSVPGIERFKVAAAENISNWYQSHVRLLSGPSGTVQIYDPKAEGFQSFGKIHHNLNGPFAYFLSTVNVDRLEPAFQICPLVSKLPPEPGEMDLLVVQPLRDPTLSSDRQESRAAFIQKIYAVLMGAYDHGGHIKLRYQGEAVGTEGDGPLIAEYVRCGGWEWAPNELDKGAHLLCVDGTVLQIPENGKATCEVLTAMPYSVCV